MPLAARPSDKASLPTSADTDGDALEDGTEVGASDKPDPLKPDTDGDNLLDGNDITDSPTRCSNAKFVALLIICKNGKWLGELTQIGDRKKVDKDGDGLPDGWEARFGSSAIAMVGSQHSDGDTLNNTEEFGLGTLPAGTGAEDTDADGLPDDWETQNGLSPLRTHIRRYFQRADWTLAWVSENDANEGGSGNRDRDGATNAQEKDANTSPVTPDTDRDGLIDGSSVAVNRNTEQEKFKLWTSQGIPYEGAGVTVTFRGETSEQTDPLKSDTDSDGILDGQEVYGYKVTVMWYEGKDLRSKDVVVKGCPRPGGAYFGSGCTSLLDADGDTISDRDELNPKGGAATPPVKDFVAKYGSDKTMMENQFNLYLRENVAPVLVTATAQSHVEWGICWFIPCVKRAWTTVYVETLDVTPQTVKVTAGWMMRSKQADLPAGRASMTVEVDIDFWLDYLVRFDVRIDLTDKVGNAMDPPYTTQVKGLFAGLLEFFEWLASGIAALASLVASALSFLVDLVVSGFKSLIKGILDTALAPANQKVGELGSSLHKLSLSSSGSFDPATGTALWLSADDIPPEFVEALLMTFAILLDVLTFVAILKLVLLAVEGVLTVAMATGIGFLIAIAIQLAVMLIFIALSPALDALSDFISKTLAPSISLVGFVAALIALFIAIRAFIGPRYTVGTIVVTTVINSFPGHQGIGEAISARVGTYNQRGELITGNSRIKPIIDVREIAKYDQVPGSGSAIVDAMLSLFLASFSLALSQNVAKGPVAAFVALLVDVISLFFAIRSVNAASQAPPSVTLGGWAKGLSTASLAVAIAATSINSAALVNEVKNP